MAEDADKPEDSELVDRAQNGERAAFQKLVERYQDKVYSICYGKVGDEHDAKDVSQDVFIKVYRYLDGFNKDAKFYTWLYRIAVNTCIDFLRKQSRRDKVDYDDTIGRDEEYLEGDDMLMPSNLGLNPDEALDRKELRKEMLAALEELSEKHRTILNLREVEGLSYREIADVLEISKGTVMSRLYHARRYFQDALRDYLGEDAPDVQN